jgi:hypothetical protein
MGVPTPGSALGIGNAKTLPPRKIAKAGTALHVLGVTAPTMQYNDKGAFWACGRGIYHQGAALLITKPETKFFSLRSRNEESKKAKKNQRYAAQIHRRSAP